MSDLTIDRLFHDSRPRPSLGLARRVLRFVAVSLARSRERRTLASLDARMLRDIGMTPYEAGVEAGKPWWQA
jgi:uncharacterized protein YjiS (DUF1127 family)